MSTGFFAPQPGYTGWWLELLHMHLRSLHCETGPGQFLKPCPWHAETSRGTPLLHAVFGHSAQWKPIWDRCSVGTQTFRSQAAYSGPTSEIRGEASCAARFQRGPPLSPHLALSFLSCCWMAWRSATASGFETCVLRA